MPVPIEDRPLIHTIEKRRLIKKNIKGYDGTKYLDLWKSKDRSLSEKEKKELKNFY